MTTFEHLPPQLGAPNLHHLEIVDKHVNGDFDRINQLVADRTSEGFHGDRGIHLGRKRTSAIDFTNPSTVWMHENIPGFSDWHGLMPTAAALEPIYDPSISVLANGRPLRPELRVWFENIADARGLRSRAELVGALSFQEIDRSTGSPIKWASLASGAAQPILDSLSAADLDTASIPELTLADYSRDALAQARRLAAARNLSEHVVTKRMNILNPKGISYDRRSNGFTNIFRSIAKLPREEFDLVEAVGILEYLKEEDWPYVYNGVMNHTKKQMAGAVSLLQNAFELVKPGGLLLVGNMLDTHPQLGFTLNVIQWPHIQPRSVDHMVGMIDKAGLDGEVDVYCPSDGVYAIYGIRKSIK